VNKDSPLFEILNSEEVRNYLRLSIPPTPARAGWEFDTDEIIRAMDYLDVRFPVHIRFITGIYRRGTHYARSLPNRHGITIHQEGNITDSNNTLWHELTHAMQSEHWMRSTGRPHNKFYRESYKPSDGRWGAKYKENTYEIQARQMAEQWEVNWRLIKETT
jgi:hypothetical protein